MTETEQIFQPLIDRIERTNNFYLKNEKSRYNLFDKIRISYSIYNWFITVFYSHYNWHSHSETFHNNELEKSLTWYDGFLEALRIIETY